VACQQRRHYGFTYLLTASRKKEVEEALEWFRLPAPLALAAYRVASGTGAVARQAKLAMLKA